MGAGTSGREGLLRERISAPIRGAFLDIALDFLVYATGSLGFAAWRAARFSPIYDWDFRV
jgi:hypothetical protein